MMTPVVHFDGKPNRGEKKKLISWLEALGYAAERENQNPHAAWQAAEYIKREFSE